MADWHNFMAVGERREIAELEKEIAIARKRKPSDRLLVLRAKRAKIQNRVTVRRRRAQSSPR